MSKKKNKTKKNKAKIKTVNDRKEADSKEEIKINPYQTQYDIPKIGFKSALLFFSLAMFTAFFLPGFLGKRIDDFRAAIVLIGGIIIGLSLPIGEYFLDDKKPIDRKFYIKSIIFISISLFILFLAYYGEFLI